MRTVIFTLSILGVLALAFAIQQTAAYAQDRCQTPGPTPAQQQQIRNQLNQWIQRGGRVISTTTTIPVAFHIVRFDDGSANVTDAQIQAQIDTLNAGYATTNFRFTLRSTRRVNRSDWQYLTYNSRQEREMKEALAVDPANVLNFYTVDLPDPVWALHGSPMNFQKVALCMVSCAITVRYRTDILQDSIKGKRAHTRSDTT